MFELAPLLHSNASLLPLGFKQRLALACATLHAPAVLFLDEPTSGVDPLMRREFWHHINALTTRGVAVVVTTHFMEEAEYCDRIGLIWRGRKIAEGDRKSTRLNSSHSQISYAVFCLKKKKAERPSPCPAWRTARARATS